MAMLQLIVSLFALIQIVAPLNPLNALTGANMIFPEKVLSKIPSVLSERIKKFDKDDDSLTTKYHFPQEYKTTLYKDQYQKTTLVNVFPKVKTYTLSPLYFDPGFQSLETSTTHLYHVSNVTIAYQTTPMLNSTLTYPTTAPMQTIGYSTPEYQHEILVYPTRINFTEVTSTRLVNFTRVETVNNELPFL